MSPTGRSSSAVPKTTISSMILIRPRKTLQLLAACLVFFEQGERLSSQVLKPDKTAEEI